MELSTEDKIHSLLRESGAPNCGRCRNFCKWNITLKQWWPYCNGSHCGSRYRVCGFCHQDFDKHSPGAGSKFCAACKQATSLQSLSSSQMTNCAWCNRIIAINPGRRSGKWPHICKECLEPIWHLLERLKGHNVPHERAKALARSPLCEICERNIVEKEMNRDGKFQSPLVVDHDHTCCPSTSKSCGQCVRGLICRSCNSAVGMIRNDAEVATRMALYLRMRSSEGATS